MGRVHSAKGLVAALLFILPSTLEARPIEPVNILSWWGYLDLNSPEIRQIEKACHAKISVDTYYTNTEFVSRLSTPNGTAYDMLIHSGTVQKKVADVIEGKGVALAHLADGYHPSIKAHYKAAGYPKNSAMFQLSLTGFLWNKTNIQISENQSLTSIFKIAAEKIVVLIDDYVEVLTLFHQSDCAGKGCAPEDAAKSFPDQRSLKTLLAKTDVIVSNDLGRIYEHPKFAFAYVWSGAAFSFLGTAKGKENYQFLVHDKLSHVSFDLLSLLGKGKGARCVAGELTKRPFLDSLSKESNYFSPYGSIVNPPNAAYAAVEKEFFQKVSTLRWLHSYSKTELDAMERTWQKLRLIIGKNL